MSQRFNFIESSLKGLYKIVKKPIEDERGFFSRFFCAEEFKKLGFRKPIAQMNHSFTKQKGAVRGMHFQYSPYTEAKIITCIRGEIFDVAVDIRKDSPTFLQWHAEVLNENNQSSLYIPDGFAHGFQTLTENCELLYIHSSFYQHDAEGGLNVLDRELSIDWPLEISEISERDQNHPMINKSFKGIDI
jgi:dTDP-4-dehydrorhamnose 3,5-epimerase